MGEGDSQRDVGAQWIAYLLGEIQYGMNWVAYSRFAHFWDWIRRDPVNRNYGYVLLWVLTSAILIVLAATTPWALPFALLMSWRCLEILVWYLKLLFDSAHAFVISPERNLFFLIFDGLFVLVGVSLWLDAADSEPRAEPPWTAGLSTFTLNGDPSGYGGWQADIATALGTVAGLLLIGAGLALVIGLVGNRFRSGPPEGYTGPLRRPRPSRHPFGPRAPAE